MPVARHAMAARPGLLAGGQRGLPAISASFISASAGWLLAVPPCAGYVRPCQTLLLRKTTDGGRTWVAVPAPPAPDQGRPGAVSQILFISSRDGWAWGPGLWQTRDGGARWRRGSIGGGPGQSLAGGGGPGAAGPRPGGPGPPLAVPVPGLAPPAPDRAPAGAPPGGPAGAARGRGGGAGRLAAAAQPVPQRVVDGGGSSTRRLAVPGLRLRARRGPAIQDRLRLG